MSRKAKKPIDISNIELTVNGNDITVKGKHGELQLSLTNQVKLIFKKIIFTLFLIQSHHILGYIFHY